MKTITVFFCGAVVSTMLLLQGFETPQTSKKRNFVDVSHTIEDGMITYQGIPAPVISSFLTREASIPRYAGGVQFLITKVDMVANTGTYLEAPFHRYENGKDLAALDLESLAYLDAIIIRVNEVSSRSIDESFFKGKDLKNKAVLIHTGWDKNWGADIYRGGTHTFLTKGAASFLVNAGAKLVGIDTYNIDDTNDKTRPVHSALLHAGIPIIEHMCDLGKVPVSEGIEFNAVPIKLKNFTAFPVRAFVTW